MKKNLIKISVIMPVHNGGAYLRETLQSVFAQSLQQFELICVDDASDDIGTRSILQSFQDTYQNMRVIRLENLAGAAEARNIGFSQAQGEYTIFLDADDLFDVDLLGEMYRCICKEHADVCVCGYQVFYMEEGRRVPRAGYTPDKFKVCCEDRDEWLLDVPLSPWSKLCRTQFLREKGIYFQSLASCNDVFFSCMVMTLAEKRCFTVKGPLVFYRTKSETQISRNRSPMDLYRAVALAYKVLGQSGRIGMDRLLKWLSSLLVWNGLIELRQSQIQEDKEQFYHLASMFLREHPVYLENKMLRAYAERMRDLPYGSGWFVGLHDREVFLWQLQRAVKELKKELDREKPVFLWGLGNRGDAFQQFCREEGIPLQGVADIRNDHVGSRTMYDYKIVSTEEVLERAAVIVASNRKVCSYLDSMDGDWYVLDLERFCPYTRIMNWRENRTDVL